MASRVSTVRAAIAAARAHSSPRDRTSVRTSTQRRSSVANATHEHIRTEHAAEALRGDGQPLAPERPPPDAGRCKRCCGCPAVADSLRSPASALRASARDRLRGASSTAHGVRHQDNYRALEQTVQQLSRLRDSTASSSCSRTRPEALHLNSCGDFQLMARGTGSVARIPSSTPSR